MNKSQGMNTRFSYILCNAELTLLIKVKLAMKISSANKLTRIKSVGITVRIFVNNPISYMGSFTRS